MVRHSNEQGALIVDADDPIARYAADLPELEPLRESKLRRPVQYRGYRELLESWAALKGARSQIIGRSVKGEPMWMVEFGNRNAKKVSVVIAGIHPIEWIGIESALNLAEEQALDPCNDRRVCFFPLVNPDGFRKVEANLRAGKRRWVRSNENGVDLNRNWPTHFKYKRGLVAGHNSSGSAALSEPEIAAIVHTLDAMVAAGDSIDIALSLHSIGKMILMPWGGLWASPQAREQHVQAAKDVRSRLGRYTIRQVSHWVPGVSFAHGMEIDHLHQAYGATSLLIECTRGELGTLRPGVLLDPFRIFNPKEGRRQGASIAQALDPFVRGFL